MRWVLASACGWCATASTIAATLLDRCDALGILSAHRFGNGCTL